MDFVKP